MIKSFVPLLYLYTDLLNHLLLYCTAASSLDEENLEIKDSSN